MYIKKLEGDFNTDKKILLTEKAAVALGNFDGLHKGHSALLNATTAYAKQYNIISCIFSFTSNISGMPYITSTEQRIKLLQNKGIDYFVMCQFSDVFKQKKPETFFREFVIEKLNTKHLVVGYNYRFGRNAEGDVKLLIDLCSEYNISYEIIPPVLFQGEVISSTAIRKSIEQGNLVKAKEMLGRDFSVMGSVVKGDNIGKVLGFPTANLNVDENHVMPPFGVYATTTRIGDTCHPSITNYGGKPTIKNSHDLIETHILDFSKDIYGETIEVVFLEKIRNIVTHDTKELLQKQLESDKKLRKKGSWA